VPGELAGLFELHKRHGKLPWARLVEPALKAARDGFEMHTLLYERVDAAKGWLKRSPTLSASFLTPSGEPKPLGALITRPKLAHTLELIAQRGAEGFYEGEVAQEMVRAIKAGGGVISLDDLKTYRPKERAALKGTYGPYELLTMPPPSSGGAVILQVLAVLEQSGLKWGGAWGLAPADHEPEQLHVLTEALKHAFADRANLMGDPDFVPVPVEQMLSSARLQQIKALFNPNKTLEHDQYGGRYAATPDGGTSHFNVIDKHGNAVALTTTVNTSFGSRFVAGESGVLLNNEMDDFVAKPGVPNAFGLVGREANAIAPLKRPLSSMSPTIIVERGEVRGMVGASGGPTIITGTLEVALNLIHKHAQTGEVATSVSAPRIHHQWSPDLLFCDEGVPEATQEALKAKGHTISAWRGGRFTSVQALWRYDAHDERGALLVGASDPTKLGRPSAVE
jgi:gamma-glutamyltranspeptidase / glutathione hydrolase